MTRQPPRPFPDTSAIASPILPLRQGEDVVVVAADLGRGAVGAEQHEIARRGLARGQEALLEVARQLDLVRQALLLDDFALRHLELARHLVHCIREETELGAVVEPERRVEVAAADALETGAQGLDRLEEQRHHCE